MNEQEKLYEQYEDAFFALLMHAVAEAEGEKLLRINNELISTPTAAIPEVISKRCQNVIKMSYRKESQKQALTHIVHALNRVALVVLVPIILFIGVFAASATVRINTLNFLIEEFDVGTAFLINSEDTVQESMLTDYLSAIRQVIPDSFALELCDEDSISYTYLFQNTDTAEIEITGYHLLNYSGTVMIDTEDADVQHETLQLQDIMIVHKGATYQIVWVNETEQTMTIVRGTNTLLDVLLPIAESIILLQE